MSLQKAGLIAALGLCFLGAPAAAQVFYSPDQQPSAWNTEQKPPTWDISLAGGAAMVPTFPGSNRYRVMPVPLFVIRWRDAVSLGADGLSLYWHSGNVRIGGGVSYDGGRADHQINGIIDGGDDRLKGLGNIGSAVGARGFFSYKLGPVYLDASVTKYLGAQNKGITVNFSASAPFKVTSQVILQPRFGAAWANEDYMQTFFGVTPLQASRSAFPAFNASAGIQDMEAGLTFIYLLGDGWFLGADASAKQYLGSPRRSPITFSNINGTIGAVVGYHF